MSGHHVKQDSVKHHAEERHHVHRTCIKEAAESTGMRLRPAVCTTPSPSSLANSLENNAKHKELIKLSDWNDENSLKNNTYPSKSQSI